MLKDRVVAAQRIAADLHDAENAIDQAIMKIAKLAGTLPLARIETNMSAIVGQEAVGKVTQAVATAGVVRQMLAEAHVALSDTQRQVGLGARMFGAGMNKPPSGILASVPTNQNGKTEQIEELAANG